MKIETSHIKSNVLFGTLLTHLIPLLAVPAMAVMSIFFRGRGRRSHGNPIELRSNSNFEWYLVIFSSIALLIITGYIYYKNHKKKYLVAVEFNDLKSELRIFYKTYYNNNIKQLAVTYSNLRYTNLAGKGYQTKKPEFNDPIPNISTMDDEKISFYNGKIYIGEISMGGTYWHKEGSKIKNILKKLEEVIPK